MSGSRCAHVRWKAARDGLPSIVAPAGPVKRELIKRKLRKDAQIEKEEQEQEKEEQEEAAERAAAGQKRSVG